MASSSTVHAPLNRFNNESRDSHVESSREYITVVMKGDPDKTMEKITVASVQDCGHTNRICLACHGEWAQEYDICWMRTVAGRDMLLKIQQIGGGS